MNQNITELLEGTLAGKYADTQSRAGGIRALCDTCITRTSTRSRPTHGPQARGPFGFRTKHVVSYAGNFSCSATTLTAIPGGFRVPLAAENETAAKTRMNCLRTKILRYT